MATVKHPSIVHIRHWLRAAQNLRSGFTGLIERRTAVPSAAR